MQVGLYTAVELLSLATRVASEVEALEAPVRQEAVAARQREVKAIGASRWALDALVVLAAKCDRTGPEFQELRRVAAERLREAQLFVD